MAWCSDGSCGLRRPVVWSSERNFSKRGDACNNAHDCLGSLVWDQRHPSCTQHTDVEVTYSVAGMASASAAASSLVEVLRDDVLALRVLCTRHWIVSVGENAAALHACDKSGAGDQPRCCGVSANVAAGMMASKAGGTSLGTSRLTETSASQDSFGSRIEAELTSP